jgi:hypothetical protein
MTYWQAKDDGREYGPFATLLEAMQSMQADDGAPELNEASRAQLGPDEEKRPYRPRKSDASVENARAVNSNQELDASLLARHWRRNLLWIKKPTGSQA